ncbi:hypothetical protein B0H14DRAFT_2613210 [Mycena olivaceomarginata]|nr:hypothetical protein B0H14DRAFT_2613210 [Mycena olivaceomarginata]
MVPLVWGSGKTPWVVSIVHRMHRRAIRATLVPLSNRDPTLPPIEKLSSHPEVPADANGTIYLWRQDHSQEAFEATLRNSANFVVPKTEKEIRERGLLLFKSGDYLVVRDKLRGDDFTEDRVVAFQVGSDKLMLAQRDRVTQVRNRVFGDTGNFVSFPAAEDDVSSPHTVPKKKRKSHPPSERCRARKRFMHLLWVIKFVDGIELDDDLALRRDLIEIAATACPKSVTFHGLAYMATTRFLWYRRILHLQLRSIPFFSQDYLISQSQWESLGFYILIPKTLLPRSRQCILSQKLPKNVHCGYFALADAGIIFELKYLSILYFSGLHFHGRSAPTYAPGTVGSLDAHWCILVNYPPSALLDGDSVIVFGGLPDATHFGVGPEFNSEMSHLRSSRGWCTQNTYTADGGTIMQPNSPFQFVIWTILTIALYFLQQLPAHYLARIDHTMFLASFSMVLDGVRVGSDDWRLGPGWIGDDVKNGKRYPLGPNGETKTHDSTHLATLYNSDSPFHYPCTTTRSGGQAYSNGRRRCMLQDLLYQLVVAAKAQLGPDADELMAGGRPSKLGPLSSNFKYVAVGLRAQKGIPFGTPPKKKDSRFQL